MTSEEQMMMQGQMAASNRDNEAISTSKLDAGAAAREQAAAKKKLLQKMLADRVRELKIGQQNAGKKKPGKKGPIAGINRPDRGGQAGDFVRRPVPDNGGFSAPVDPGYGRIAPTKGEKVVRMPKPKATKRYM